MLTQTQFYVDQDTKQLIKYLCVRWQYNNVKTTFQMPFSDTVMLILNKKTKDKGQHKQDIQEPIIHLISQKHHKNVRKTF